MKEVKCPSCEENLSYDTEETLFLCFECERKYLMRGKILDIFYE